MDLCALPRGIVARNCKILWRFDSQPVWLYPAFRAYFWGYGGSLALTSITLRAHLAYRLIQWFLSAVCGWLRIAWGTAKLRRPFCSSFTWSCLEQCLVLQPFVYRGHPIGWKRDCRKSADEAVILCHVVLPWSNLPCLSLLAEEAIQIQRYRARLSMHLRIAGARHRLYLLIWIDLVLDGVVLEALHYILLETSY